MQTELIRVRAQQLTQRAELYAALYRPSTCPVQTTPVYWITHDSVLNNFAGRCGPLLSSSERGCGELGTAGASIRSARYY